MDVPLDEGVGGEDAAEDDDKHDDTTDEAERLLRFRMVEGDEEIPSSSALPYDATIDHRVEDRQRLDESVV